MEAVAKVTHVRIAPRKVRVVIDLIRGKSVGEAIGILRNTPKAASPVVEKLLKSAKTVICTCGADGAYAYTENAQIYVPSEKVEAKDTTGAGDAFIGSFLYSLYRSGFDKQRLDKITEAELAEFVKASARYCGISVQGSGAIESYPDYI